MNVISKGQIRTLELLAEDGRNTTSTADEQLNIHPMTIRKAFKELRGEGLVRRLDPPGVGLHEITNDGIDVLNEYQSLMDRMESVKVAQTVTE